MLQYAKYDDAHVKFTYCLIGGLFQIASFWLSQKMVFISLHYRGSFTELFCEKDVLDWIFIQSFNIVFY